MSRAIRIHYTNLCRRVPATWWAPKYKTLTDLHQSITNIYHPADYKALMRGGIRYRKRQATLSRRTFWYWFGRANIDPAQIMEKGISGAKSVQAVRRSNSKKRALHSALLYKKNTLNEIKWATKGIPDTKSKPRYRGFIYQTNSIGVEGVRLSAGPYPKQGAIDAKRVHQWNKGNLHKVPNKHYKDWWKNISNGTEVQRNNAESSWCRRETN